MSTTAHGISVALLRPLAELLGRLEISPERFLSTLGIDEGSAPDTYVAGEDVDRLLDELAAERGDATFALTLARAAVVRPLGLYGHMVWLSGTVRDALTRAVRFYSVVTRRSALTMEESGELVTLRQHKVANIAHAGVLTEFAFASLVLHARAATSKQFHIRAMRFAHTRALESHPAYRELFDAPVTFGHPIDELELVRTQLELRLESADPITAAALEARVAQLTAGATGRSMFLDRVRRVAAAKLAEQPSLVTIGGELGVSARTLRRHLEQEQTSFRAILDEVRRERADELLAAGTTAKEISFSLGFSEPSAFSRAYKRWTGRTPKVR